MRCKVASSFGSERVADELKADYVFLGEGVADNVLLRKLCEKRDLPAFDYPFPDNLRDEQGKTIGGKDQFGNMLRRFAGYVRTRNLFPRGILIAVDCGDDWKKSFDNVARQIKAAEIGGQRLYPRPQEPLSRVAANIPGLPPLVIVMVPGVGRTGGMETLCVEVLRNKHPKTAGCLEGYLACLEGKSVGLSGWGAETRSKAEMQCLIAATNRDDPNKSARFAIEADLIDVSRPAFNALAADLRTAVAALSGG